MRENLHDLLELSDDERRRIDANTRRWNAMDEEERERMRTRMRRLREMSPEERREWMDRSLQRDEGAAE